MWDKLCSFKAVGFAFHVLHCFNIGCRSLLGKSNRDIPRDIYRNALDRIWFLFIHDYL